MDYLVLVDLTALQIDLSISPYNIYNTNCVFAFVRTCVRACVKYRRPNDWTDHDQMARIDADRSGNGSYLNKLVPRMARKGGGHSSKRVHSGHRAL